MPAGRFTLFSKGIRRIMQGEVDLDTNPLWCASVHRGYTPNTASHSAYVQVSAFLSSAGGNSVTNRQLSGISVTGSGQVATKLSANNITGFSRGGSLFQSKRVVLFASASAVSIDNFLVGFLDVDPDITTGVESMQVDVQWPSNVVFKIDTNP